MDYIADGLFRTEEDVAKHATQNGGEGLGRIRYRDLNEDGKIDEDDRTWIGSPHPDFMYGLNIELSYKNFDLSAFFYGVNGIDVNTYAVKSETDFWSINESVPIKAHVCWMLGVPLILIRIFLLLRH